MSGQAATSVRVPLPGSWAVYGGSNSFNHYEHLDWLGNSRLSSNQSRAMTSDIAYAPFGEPYASSATSGVSFTGMRSDVVAASGTITTGLYDFQARELPPSQGRWISPDPAGVLAADPSNPQSWNRYAYALNDPLSNTDPTGLECVWDDGSYDAADDPDSGSGTQCGALGGTWIEPGIFEDAILTGGEWHSHYGDWSSSPSSYLAENWVAPQGTAYGSPMAYVYETRMR